MFYRYEFDIRSQANPEGIIDIRGSANSEFKMCVFSNGNLKPQRDFINEMRTQHQTLLELGVGFPVILRHKRIVGLPSAFAFVDSFDPVVLWAEA